MGSFDPELDKRIRSLESQSDQGGGFSKRDWLLLIALGVLLPVVMLLWGWPW